MWSFEPATLEREMNSNLGEFVKLTNTNLEYIGLPEWLRTKKCFFLLLHEMEASSCTLFINQTEYDITAFTDIFAVVPSF